MVCQKLCQNSVPGWQNQSDLPRLGVRPEASAVAKIPEKGGWLKSHVSIFACWIYSSLLYYRIIIILYILYNHYIIISKGTSIRMIIIIMLPCYLLLIIINYILFIIIILSIIDLSIIDNIIIIFHVHRLNVFCCHLHGAPFRSRRS